MGACVRSRRHWFTPWTAAGSMAKLACRGISQLRVTTPRGWSEQGSALIALHSFRVRHPCLATSSTGSRHSHKPFFRDFPASRGWNIYKRSAPYSNRTCATAPERGLRTTCDFDLPRPVSMTLHASPSTSSADGPFDLGLRLRGTRPERFEELGEHRVVEGAGAPFAAAHDRRPARHPELDENQSCHQLRAVVPHAAVR